MDPAGPNDMSILLVSFIFFGAVLSELNNTSLIFTRSLLYKPYFPMQKVTRVLYQVVMSLRY